MYVCMYVCTYVCIYVYIYMSSNRNEYQEHFLEVKAASA